MPEKPVIIKRGDEEAHDDHHGGAWKVAYADFMTAMMAFFLLLWILAASDEEKLRGLADYFTPSLSEAGGRGQGFFDGQVLADDGTLSGTDGPQSVERLPSFGQENPLAVFDSRLRDEEEVAPPDANELRDTVPDDGQPPGAHNTADAAAEESGGSVSYGDDQENERLELLERLRDQIEAAVAADPELAGLQRHLRFELSPEGLEIQMVDDERRSMFDLGSANLDGRTRDLVALVGRAIAPINKPVAISGHTDSLPFGPAAAYTNWELSTDRAHATRRELVAQGVSPGRFLRIVGLADTVPLDPDLPDAPENRRIGILLVYPSAVRAGDVDLRQN